MDLGFEYKSTRVAIILLWAFNGQAHTLGLMCMPYLPGLAGICGLEESYYYQNLPSHIIAIVPDHLEICTEKYTQNKKRKKSSEIWEENTKARFLFFIYFCWKQKLARVRWLGAYLTSVISLLKKQWKLLIVNNGQSFFFFLRRITVNLKYHQTNNWNSSLEISFITA